MHTLLHSRLRGSLGTALMLLGGLLLNSRAGQAQTAYCATGLGGSCGGNDISAVSLSGTTLNATGLTCAGTGGQAYTSYPASGATTATISGGVPYTLSVTLTGASIVSVWVDYNRNFTFESNEWTQVTTSSPTGAPATVSLLMPSTAAQGSAGLRVRSRATGNLNGAADACSFFGSGETKDFTVTIGAPAACPAVTGLTATGITGSGATVSFASVSAASSYTLTLTPAGGPATTQTVTASPVALTGLVPSTAYTASIVGNCGAGQTSAANSITFATTCAGAPHALVNNTTPFVQDFEATWLSQCATNDAPGPNWRTTPLTGNTAWRRDDNGASAAWVSPTAGAYTPAGSPLGGGTSLRSARFHSYNVTGRGTGNLDLYLNMAGTGGTPTLNFDYINTSGSDSLSVLLSTDGGATFTARSLARFTLASAWTRQTVNLPATGLTAITVVRLRATGDFGVTDIGVDNLRVAYVACPPVTGLAASGITATGASIGFTAGPAGTAYAVTVTPAGGPATTQTATASPVALTGLSPNTTYTVSIVSSCGGGQTSQPAVVIFSTNPVPATNDECTAAVAVPVATTCASPTSGTVFGATQSLAPTASCGFGVTTARDVWYSFVATSASHTISLAPQFAASYDVRTGTCAASTSVFCSTATTGGTNSSTVGSLTVGQTYFVRVYPQSATAPTATNSSFTLCIVTGPATPANDDCAGALNVPIQFGTCIGQTSADNTAATNSTGAPTPACAQYMGKDIWFKVTVPVSGAVTVKTLAPTGGSAIIDTGLSMYSGTCVTLTEIGCNDDANGLYSELAFTGRTPGEVLYIRTWAYDGGATGLIAVCATSPSNCAAPAGPTAANVTNTTAQLNWAAPTGGLAAGGTYELEYGPQGFLQGSGTLVTGLTANTLSLGNLQANTAYCFYVRQNCGGTNGSSAYVGPACFTTPLTAPSSDEPCNAVTLGTAPLSGSNVGATTSIQNGINTPACSPAPLPKDVWFVFTATATSRSLTVTGSAAGMVRVFTSPDCAAGPFTQVFCQGSGQNNTNVGPINLTNLVLGTRYYVAVSGYGGSDVTGAFTIQLGAPTATRAQAETSALLVYPNPSGTGQLTLRLSSLADPGQATLLNALGQSVLSKALVAGAPELLLSTRGLAAGVYTLRVAVAGQVLTRKVILE